MADVNRGDRPLSPHLAIYRPQWTWLSSIFVRITGNALIVAALLVVWWFVAAATGPAAYDLANAVMTSWLGDVVMFLSVGALWYHTLGGIRHLIWDQGYMLDVDRSERAAKIMVILTLVLTVLTAFLL